MTMTMVSFSKFQCNLIKTFQNKATDYINCIEIIFGHFRTTRKWYFVTKIVLNYSEKKNVLVIVKIEIRAKGRDLFKQ